MTRRFISLLLFYVLVSSSFLFSAPISEQIIIDQIGYRVNSDKWLMIADPRVGQNSAVTYVPGANAQLRRASDSVSVMTIPLTLYGSGTISAQTGDVVWQGNFSSYITPGIYHIFDPTNNYQSYDFVIGDDIYNTILQASVKSFYYQRCGTGIPATYGGAWTHTAACHMQQATAHLYDGSDLGAPKDVTGGWHDAGDYRKYVTFTFTTLWDLMHAYDWYPTKFGDATGIPESNNGTPDILDEIKYELDWLLKMQKPDGSLYSGVFVTANGSNTGDGNPAADNTVYYYSNFSTAATSTGAMAFALGSRLIAPFNPSYALTLKTAAELAWTFLETHTSNITYNHTGFSNANANWDAAEDAQTRVAAAAELWHLTATTKYKTYVDANYNSAATTDGGWHQPIINGYFETGASNFIQRGLVSYALAPGASAAVVTAIKTALNQGIQNQAYGQRNNDPYKAYMWNGHYSWGSNSTKGEWGGMALWGNKLNVNAGLATAYNAVAEEYVHYIHGRNPLSWCYVTQSQLFGADKSITQFYHSWFDDGTAWDLNPAPGFLAGGANDMYESDTENPGNPGGTAIYPPGGEPIQKSYKDWNAGWPESSWSVSENGIYYNARYSLLLAAFCGNAGPAPTATVSPTSTPYAGTPTFTHTVTPTFTNTPTPAFDLIYDGDTPGYTISDGTVHLNAGGTGTLTQAASGNPGNAFVVKFEGVTGYWQQHYWDNATNVNIGANTFLVMNVKQDPSSPNAVSAFYIRINWGGTYLDASSYLVEGGVIDGTWKTVRMPLSAMLEAMQTTIDFVAFIDNTELTSYTVLVDNIRLEANPPTATPTSTRTVFLSATPSATKTRTPTVVNSVTPTVTGSVTASVTSGYTGTNTPSVTMTHTKTQTATVTQSVTGTVTPMFTKTYTPSCTATQTVTQAMTQTVTKTVTQAMTQTVTQIVTQTVTQTGTPTMTQTGTQTGTPTMTQTGTQTGTESPTETPYAGSPTDTGTITATPTLTLTMTCTDTATSTKTITQSSTPTLSETVTGTPTGTQTATESHTATESQTVSQTPTASQTPTQSFTPTESQTLTDTPTTVSTGTYSPTSTQSPTAEKTFTITPTAEQTPTVTLTAEDTPAETITPSCTHTNTPVAAASATGSATATATQTMISATTTTVTPSVTPAGTSTPDAAAEVIEIKNVVTYPNPSKPGRGITARFLLTRDASEINIKVYTSSERLIGKKQISAGTAAGEKVLFINGGLFEGISNGVYFYVLEAAADDGTAARSRPGKILILK